MKHILPALLGLLVIAGCTSRREARRESVAHQPVITVVEETRDPVCGMEVQAGTGPRESYKGKMYYFCSEDCEVAFTTDPSCYAEGVPAPEVVD